MQWLKKNKINSAMQFLTLIYFNWKIKITAIDHKNFEFLRRAKDEMEQLEKMPTISWLTSQAKFMFRKDRQFFHNAWTAAKFLRTRTIVAAAVCLIAALSGG